MSMQKYDLDDFDTSNISDKNGRLFMEKTAYKGES